ncbi:hypothetical protein ACO0QE_000460 [Hanseniaspora vineae]
MRSVLIVHLVLTFFCTCFAKNVKLKLKDSLFFDKDEDNSLSLEEEEEVSKSVSNVDNPTQLPFEQDTATTSYKYFGPIKNQSPYFKNLSSEYPYLKYIDVFYGTENGGHMFPGPNLPFGMCKIGVDIANPSEDSYAGYGPQGSFLGISMLHLSGTGGAPTYGVASQIPYTDKDLGTLFDSHSFARLTTGNFSTPRELQRAYPDYGHLGYYQVSLDNGVNIEFSNGYKSGIIKYDFPKVNICNNIFVNLTHHLHTFARPWWTQNFESGYIKVNKNHCSYQGALVINGGWSSSDSYKVYFYGEFNQKFEHYVHLNGEVTFSKIFFNWAGSENGTVGTYFQFSNRELSGPLVSHIGVSFRSVQEAKRNVENDYPGSSRFNLQHSVENAVQQWDSKVFSKYQNLNYSNENDVVLEKFYTSIYGSHFMPTNKTGVDSPFYDKDCTTSSCEIVPYYDDWFTIWDTFRSLHPMLNIVNREVGSELVRALIEIWKFEDFMPDGRSAGRSGRTQGGSNSDIVLADAFVKNISYLVDWEAGFKAMQSNADVIPPYVLDPFAPDSTNKFGRGALKEWLELGYITRNFSRSVTRSMEYSYNDYALSVVAKGLGYDDLHKKYLKRSSGWQQIWNFNATLSDKSYKGFIGPKNADGEFNYENYDPSTCFSCYWADDEYEGSPLEYGWAVPHDISSLLSFIGSNETFQLRLDDMFSLYGNGYANIGNEPSFLTPYLYNFINNNDRTSETLNYLTTVEFTTGVNGLPGNSDAGSMQSWLWFALVGIYPVAGTDVYLLNSPQITYWELQEDPFYGAGRTVFEAENLYKNATSGERNIYIKQVSLNGENLSRNWIQHHELFGPEGGHLKFVMTDTAQHWDKDSVTPPSRGHFERKK